MTRRLQVGLLPDAVSDHMHECRYILPLHSPTHLCGTRFRGNAVMSSPISRYYRTQLLRPRFYRGCVPRAAL